MLSNASRHQPFSHPRAHMFWAYSLSDWLPDLISQGLFTRRPKSGFGVHGRALLAVQSRGVERDIVQKRKRVGQYGNPGNSLKRHQRSNFNNLDDYSFDVLDPEFYGASITELLTSGTISHSRGRFWAAHFVFFLFPPYRVNFIMSTASFSSDIANLGIRAAKTREPSDLIIFSLCPVSSGCLRPVDADAPSFPCSKFLRWASGRSLMGRYPDDSRHDGSESSPTKESCPNLDRS